MTETLTARFGFTHWGDGSTDGPSRVEFNDAFAALEDLAAIDTQDVLASRPAAGEAQRYFYATDTEVLYRDNGSAWKVVGSHVLDAVAASTANGVVPWTVNAATGQTADLAKFQVNSVDKARITADGNVIAANLTATNSDITSTVAATRGLTVTGHASQSADLLALRNSAAADQFTVGPAGAIGGTLFSVQTDRALLGGTGFVTLANQTTYTGTAALEVRSTKGGTGTYTDALVIRHPQFTNTAVTRRLGVLLKLGDEISGDAAKAGGMYVESALADAATPKLVLQRGDSAAMTFFPSAQAQIHGQGLIVEDVVDINKTGSPSLRFNTNVMYGAQSTSAYSRVSVGQSWYWYSSGVHSDTPGAAGSGGTTAASLTAAGLFTVPRLLASSTAGLTLAESVPALMLGAANSTNLIGSNSGLQARNNGSAATLQLNPSGGTVTLASASGTTDVAGPFRIQGRRLTISDSAPSSPSVGDVWIDT